MSADIKSPDLSSLRPPLSELAAVCRREVLREKWLVAPSPRAGQQWLDELARHHVPVLNVHLFSPRSLALTMAAPALAAAGAAPVLGAEAAWWMDFAWQSLSEPLRGDLTSGPVRPALAEAMRRSMEALRLTGLAVESLLTASDTSDTSAGAAPPAAEADLSGPSKFQQLASLLDHYLQLLQTHQRWDYAQVLRCAAGLAHSEGLPRDVLLIVAADAAQWPLEAQLLTAAPAAQRCELPATPAPPAPTSPGGPAEACESDRQLLAWLDAVHKAPPPAGDGTVQFFQAVGEANEVREVFRRIVAGGLPLDEVELLYVNAETYLPLCYELARTWVVEGPSGSSAGLGGAAGPTGIPVTFAEGISTRYSRPGQALLQWLRWVREGFPQQLLVDMYQEGLFSSLAAGKKRSGKEKSGRSSAPTAWQLARRLREAPIGLGRDRYPLMLDRQVAAARRAVRQAKQTVAAAKARATRAAAEDEDDVGTAVDGLQRSKKRWFHWRVLRRHVGRLLELTPDEGDSPDAVLQQIQRFLLDHTVRSSAFDNASLRQLRSAVADVRRWLQTAQPPDWDVWRWLTQLVQETQAHDSGPLPGAVHVSPALQGGHSHRRYTFIVGLDDSKFPGLGLQDPILLDDERQRIDGSLPLGGDEPRRKIQALAQTFARLTGNVTLSCTSESLVEDRSQYPSPVFRAAARLVGVAPEQWQQPVSFAPQSVEQALSEGQWWLAHLCSFPGEAAQAQVRQHYPHLGRGAAATSARYGNDLTPYNGHVPQAAAALSPLVDPAELEQASPGDRGFRGWSASAMETAGACSLRYFFRYGLKVRPLDEWVMDDDRWLDPLQYGSLLHEVFRDFMSQCVAQQELPDFERHHRLLARILKTHIDEEQQRHPPPSQSALRQQVRLMQIASQVFLDEEQKHCREFQPRFFEAAVGLASDENPSPIDSPDPLPIMLPDGRCIAAAGRVDRIDEHRDDTHLYQIWDYKTGSARRYEVKKPFQQGRHVQNVFYHALVERALVNEVAPEASVSGFGYFFPGATAWGHRIQWTAEELATGRRVLGLLADVMGGGAYLPTHSEHDCRYCDYREICEPGVKGLTFASKKQVEGDTDNSGLTARKELKDVK